jgi:hypothetical protein
MIDAIRALKSSVLSIARFIAHDGRVRIVHGCGANCKHSEQCGPVVFGGNALG